MTRQILEMARKKVNVLINHWHLIMIVSTSIQNIYSKLWEDSFVAFKFNPHHCFSFSERIKKIVLAVKIGRYLYGLVWDALWYFDYFVSEKTKHTTIISMKLSTKECICNYKQIDLKIYSGSQ